MAEIKLVRVDYRLIHGQVVARWLKVCPVRRIVLVDDVLGSDEFMSDIYKMAVPKGTDVDIVTIDKAKEVLDNTDDTVFLISKDIETCLKLVEKGVELPAINVGAVPNEEGRKLITTGVAISQKELDMLEECSISIKKLDSPRANMVRGIFYAFFQTFCTNGTRDFLRFFFCAVKEETVCTITRKKVEKELRN